MTRRKPPKRRNPIAKSLRSPALRQRVVPAKRGSARLPASALRDLAIEDGGTGK